MDQHLKRLKNYKLCILPTELLTYSLAKWLIQDDELLQYFIDVGGERRLNILHDRIKIHSNANKHINSKMMGPSITSVQALKYNLNNGIDYFLWKAIIDSLEQVDYNVTREIMDISFTTFKKSLN